MNAISRRDFAAGLGGITLAFTFAPRRAFAQQPAAQQPARLPGSLDNNRLLDAWIRIGTDGNATVCTGKVELGQGIVTALAQIAAEELDLPRGRVQMISGDTEKTPNEGVTAGSQSIENSGTALRLAGAQVRAILLELAAKRLGADAAALSVAEGGIAYVQDLRLPGMLHGRIVRPPGYGAKLEGFDQARIKAVRDGTLVGWIAEREMLQSRIARPLGDGAKPEGFDEARLKAMLPGVVAVVRDGSFLGVIAERAEQAIK